MKNKNKQGISMILLIGIIVVLLILATVLVLSLKGNNGESINTTTPTQQEETKTEEKKEEEKEDGLLVGTNQVTLENIYYDTPNMHYIESGYADIYIDNYDKFVTFFCDWEKTVDSPKGAHDVLFQSYKDSVMNHAFLNELGEIKEKNITVNGIDVYTFEGTINAGLRASRDEYIKGYTFIFEGLPCAIYGVVMDENQPQEDIQYISDVVDAMMKSVRNTPEK